MAITTSTWKDLGFGRVNLPLCDSKINSAFIQIIENSELWEKQSLGSEIWIRDRGRIKNNIPSFLLVDETCITPSNYHKETYEIIDRYERSEYSKYHERFIQNAPDKINMVKDTFSTDKPVWQQCSDFSDYIFGTPAKDMKKCLKEHFIPTFFNKYPNGRVLMYRVNDKYEDRYTILRAGYSLSEYSFDSIYKNDFAGFNTLKNWHTVDPMNQSELILSLLSLTLYPKIPFFWAYTYGLIIVFIFDQAESEQLGAFPSSWMAKIISPGLWGVQKRNIQEIMDNYQAAERAGHQRYLFREHKVPSSEEIVAFIQKMVVAYNELIYKFTDIVEFHHKDSIDFVSAFEQNLTLNRIFRIALLCIASNNVTNRHLCLFQLADLLEEIRKCWIKEPSTQFFKYLFKPSVAQNMVADCVDLLPAPYKDIILKISDEIYQDELKTIKESVWIKDKLCTDGVFVRNKELSGEKKETWDDFCANILRAYRNTHHGYLTEADPQNRPSRYLSLVDGSMSESLSALGLIWVISLICNPEKIIGWKCLDGEFDPVPTP